VEKTPIALASALQQRTALAEARLLSLLRQSERLPPAPVGLFAGCRRVVVLAPHFDDEIISCGGAILHHLRRKQEVTVLYVTDGSASAGSGLTPSELSAVRRTEAARSNRILGVTRFRCLGQPDGRLEARPELAALLADHLAGADLVYAPHATDSHPDHQAVYQALQQALARTGRRPRVAYYEFWRPINPNYFLDISTEMVWKVEALREHQSQLQYLDYVHLMSRLNEYRGGQIGVAYAEAFYLEADEVRA
jgi:LmbE family N-acetylglucosaminyl deacetylase